jgi:hypothetical protein
MMPGDMIMGVMALCEMTLGVVTLAVMGLGPARCVGIT